MALTSVFYDAPVTETDWAKSRAGAPDYGVYGADDFKVSTHPSIPYALVVKAGKAHGWGVTDTAASDQTVQAATLSTGTRWDLVVVRRNWQPAAGGPTTLEIIQGGSTQPNIQTLRTIGPGVEDDQPIALVQWTGGVNTPSSIVDLRCWAGNGGMVASNLLALNYLATPGADVMISGTTWRYSADSNGVWGWVATVGAGATSGFVQPTGWSLSGNSRISAFSSTKSRVDVDVNITRTGANTTITTAFNSLGGVFANAARGDSGGVKYLIVAVSGGSGNNGGIAMVFVNTISGEVGFRSANGSNFTWTSGAVSTLNFTYYI